VIPPSIIDFFFNNAVFKIRYLEFLNVLKEDILEIFLLLKAYPVEIQHPVLKMATYFLQKII